MASGAVDKILSKISVEEFLRLENLAEKMYDGFRIANDDFAKIASKVKFNADDLKAIKEHLFLKEHKFADGSVRKFDANYWQAEAWERITKGNPIESDFTLLKHELFELNYMKKNNAPYEVAHKKANELHNWSMEVFGE